MTQISYASNLVNQIYSVTALLNQDESNIVGLRHAFGDSRWPAHPQIYVRGRSSADLLLYQPRRVLSDARVVVNRKFRLSNRHKSPARGFPGADSSCPACASSSKNPTDTVLHRCADARK